MRKFLLLVFISIFYLSVNAQSKDELAIRNVLSTQSQAWNDGNLELFMNGYWQSDSLMFIGKTGVT